MRERKTIWEGLSFFSFKCFPECFLRNLAGKFPGRICFWFGQTSFTKSRSFRKQLNIKNENISSLIKVLLVTACVCLFVTLLRKYHSPSLEVKDSWSLVEILKLKFGKIWGWSLRLWKWILFNTVRLLFSVYPKFLNWSLVEILKLRFGQERAEGWSRLWPWILINFSFN